MVHIQQSHTTLTHNTHTHHSPTTLTKNIHTKHKHTTLTHNTHTQHSHTTLTHNTQAHSWAQQKLSPLNIFLSINGLLLSLGFNGFDD